MITGSLFQEIARRETNVNIQSPLLIDTLIPAFSRGEKEILRGFLNIYKQTRDSTLLHLLKTSW